MRTPRALVGRLVGALLGTAAVALIASAVAARPTQAQAPPTPAPTPTATVTPRPRTVTPPPGVLMLPPFGKGSFFSMSLARNPGTPAPGVDLYSITVRSLSDQPVTVRDTNENFGIFAPAGYLVRFLAGCDGPVANPARCEVATSAFAACRLQSADCEITFTTEEDPTRIEPVALPAGCSNISGRWALNTPPSTVAASVTPRASLWTIWRLDAATQHFVLLYDASVSPSYPPTTNDLDAIVVCLGAPATIGVPVRP